MLRMSFDSRDLPRNLTPQRRAHLWIEAVTASSMSFDIEYPRPDTFHGSNDLLQAGSVFVGRATANAVIVRRTRAHIASDMDDRLLVFINVGRKPVGAQQGKHELTLAPSQAVILLNGEPSLTHAMNGGSVLAIYVPRDMIGSPDRLISPGSGIVTSSDSAPLRLLISYARALLDEPATLMPGFGAMVGSHIADLVRALYGTENGAPVPRGTSAALTGEIIRRIERHALDPGLSAGLISASLGISERQLQYLLQNTGKTFTAEVSRVRLNRVRQMLSSKTYSAMPITDIAFQCGFESIATFYRTFNKQFGMTPSQMRQNSHDR